MVIQCESSILLCWFVFESKLCFALALVVVVLNLYIGWSTCEFKLGTVTSLSTEISQFKKRKEKKRAETDTETE